jgi:hypothetical protein
VQRSGAPEVACAVEGVQEEDSVKCEHTARSCVGFGDSVGGFGTAVEGARDGARGCEMGHAELPNAIADGRSFLENGEDGHVGRARAGETADDVTRRLDEEIAKFSAQKTFDIVAIAKAMCAIEDTVHEV